MTMPTALATPPSATPPAPLVPPSPAGPAADAEQPRSGPARAPRRAGTPGTALVAGAAGFVGSHLCERLVQAGWTVIALDDLSTGAAVHLAPLQAHPRFRFVRHDITAALPEVRAVDRIFNLACPASPAYYQRHPVKTVLASTLGTWNLAELALERGARLLHVSTSEVYGDPQVHPQPERYWGHVNPTGPRACYDEGKRCAEALLTSAQRERGLDVRIARLFNSYGPRLRAGDGRVVSNFVVQALAGEPLTVYGDGTQTRSFCFVDDTVDGLLALMDSDLATPVNIGNPDEHTMLELAAHVIAATGSRSTLVFRPLPVDDPVRRRPDIALAKRRLGWAPQVPLAQGLARTIAWFRSGAAQEAA
jgi:UDP-glucuronate decarboxylase